MRPVGLRIPAIGVDSPSLVDLARQPDGVERYAEDAFPTAAVYGDSTHRSELRLITCGGDFDDETGHDVDDVVAYAHLVWSTAPAVTGSSSDCSVWVLHRLPLSSILLLLVSNRACAAGTPGSVLTMGHYKRTLRDVEFNLFEVFGTDRVLGAGPFGQLDVDSARDVLKEVERLSTGDLATSFADADRNPPVLDPQTGTVRLPASF